MRLTIRAFGLDLLDVELTTDAPGCDEDDGDYSRDLSGGTTYASPMGFSAHMEVPHEVETPDRDW